MYAQLKILTIGAQKKEVTHRELMESSEVQEAIASAAQDPRIQHLASTLVGLGRSAQSHHRWGGGGIARPGRGLKTGHVLFR